jgi:hypothetical protein
MKACNYCGRQNGEDALNCYQCGTAFDTVVRDGAATPPVLPAWARIGLQKYFPHFTALHGKILFWMYVAAAGLTFLVLLPGNLSGHGESQIVGASLGAFCGPFVGAIARNFQPCCWKFSTGVFPFCAAILGAGTLVQLIPLPSGPCSRRVRIFTWCIGLCGWFAGIPISFLHAIS